MVGLGLVVGLAACGPGGDDEPGECAAMLIAGDLVITEVFADADAPSGGSGVDDGREWFEIYNNADRPLDLRGLTITHSRPDGSQAKTHVVQTVTIPSAGYLVLGNTAPDLVPGWVDYGYGADLGDMYNSDGGKITLSCTDTEIDSAVYEMVETGHSREFDGGGLPDYTANDVLANWCESTPEGASEFDPANFGTPGSPNEDCAVIIAGQCTDNGTSRDAVPPMPGDLIVTEVMPSPSGDDDLQEWFEVLVMRDVDLNGVGLDRAGDTTGPRTIDSEACIRVTAGQRLVFARSSDMTMNGGLPEVAGTFTFSLVGGSASSPGDVQIMFGTTTIDGFAWTRSSTAAALQLDPDHENATDNDLEANWCNATMPYGPGTDRGTPGAANEDCPVVVQPGECIDEGTGNPRDIVEPTAGQIEITEWMPDPSLVGDTAGEWVEVRASASFDLNGLQLGDANTPLAVVVPAVTCLPIGPGDYALFAQSADMGTNGGLSGVDGVFPTGVDLTNQTGMVLLGVGGAMLDSAMWTTSSSGKSIQIDTDGTQCNAPTGTPAYNGTDLGTPEAVHAAECP